MITDTQTFDILYKNYEFNCSFCYFLHLNFHIRSHISIYRPQKKLMNSPISVYQSYIPNNIM